MELKSAIIKMRQAGVGPREIGRRLNLSTGVVSGTLFRAGLTSSGNIGRSRGYDPTTRALIVEGAKKRGVAVVADEWGIHRNTIYRWAWEQSQ